jgi:hypothetical protein
MRRRNFIKGIVGSAAAWPLTVKKMAYATTDEQRLHGDIHSDETLERVTADQEWWRAQSIPFPAPPIKGTDFLVPLSSFDDLLSFHQEMGIPLEKFWAVETACEIAYFFKWNGHISALVLAVFGGNELIHVECLAQGDRPVPMPQRSQILTSVVRAFAAADFEVESAERVVRKASLN